MANSNNTADVKIEMRARAFTGQGVALVRCLVEPDGSVLVWDRIAGHYTRCHALSEAAERRARKLAAKELAGRGGDREPLTDITGCDV